MRKKLLFAGLTSGVAGAGMLLAFRRKGHGPNPPLLANETGDPPKRPTALESFMAEAQDASHTAHVRKPVPAEFFTDRGSGRDFETRPEAWDGFITPIERFYLRSYSPTPKIDVSDWRLKIDGTGVENPVELTYKELEAMPQVTLSRTLECAGNGRRFFKENQGKEGEGTQWSMGAMGCAEWTGVLLRNVLERAGVRGNARHVMPVGLDEQAVSRPMPLEKALRDDTLLVLRMNGETLPPDHGYPVRVLVTGWAGAASIKWVGRIIVAEEALYSPFNTTKYILQGPGYPAEYPAMGPPVTEMPVVSVLDLGWPARLSADAKELHGRSYAGEARVREVVYSIDQQEWQPAELTGPDVEGCWRQWLIRWEPTPGKHEIRVRTTDERGRTQPDTVSWNQHGYLYNAVVAHPVIVSAAS